MDNDQAIPGRDERGDVVGELIRSAGRREKPSADEYTRVYAAAAAALEHKIRDRRRRRFAVGMAATAVVGALVVTIVARLPGPATQPLAAVDRVIGPAEFTEPGAGGWRPVTVDGMALARDARVRTGATSRLGIVLADGVSLRLAEATEVRFVAPGWIELLSGKVYADAGGAGSPPGSPRIRVDTAGGTTWDVGTQFEVSYTRDVYRLRVREGAVRLQQHGHALRGEAGEQLTIERDRQVRRERIARDDPAWAWVQTVAPDPLIDARPVSAFLEWVSRETGYQVEYAQLDLELKAETTILYGSVYGIAPLDALDTMLATTDFDYTLLEDGKILIDSR